MPAPPLSYSTTSLSTTHSGCFTETSDSTEYTSDGQRDSPRGVKGSLCRAGGEGKRKDAGGQEDEMEKFLLGPGWRDNRVPPSERLKHLYRLLEEHYDLTGGDYYGQSTFHVCRTTSGSRGATRLEEYPIACVRYLTTIGVDLDFLEDSGDISPDPMNDLINEAFCQPQRPIPKPRAGPISTWEVDWSRPLPQVTLAYWEMMQRTRPKLVHEFRRAKPIAGNPGVVLQPQSRREEFPLYCDVEANVYHTGGFRAILHKIRELVASH